MNFREATDRLFSQIDHGALADKLHVSVASVRQARLRSDSLAHRAPPKEWERAVLSLAEQQIEHYRKLVDALRKEGGKEHQNARSAIRGRPITE